MFFFTTAYLGLAVLGTQPLLKNFKSCHCRIMTGNAANCSTATSTRAADQYIFQIGLHTPALCGRVERFIILRKWPAKWLMKYVSPGEPEGIFEISSSFRLNTRLAIFVTQQ